jgi:hypothetical protein
MPTIQEIQARAQALKQAAADGAVPKSPATEAPTSQIQSGMQGSNESAGVTVSAFTIPDDAEYDAALAAKALAAFKATGLRKHIREDSTEMRSIKGFFYPTTHAELRDMEHYASLHKVKRYEAPQESQ